MNARCSDEYSVDHESSWRSMHAAALERVITALLRRKPMDVDRIGHLLLRDLPEGDEKVALLRCRFAVGLSTCPNSRVMVGEHALRQF